MIIQIGVAVLKLKHPVLMEVLIIVESSPGIVNITRLNDGNETPAGTTIKVRISGVKNIPYSGDVGDYNISTKQSDGTFIDFTDVVTNEPIFVPATLHSGNVTVANNTKARAGQEGTLHIRMTLSSNPLPVDGKILIRLPGEYCNDVPTLIQYLWLFIRYRH